VRGLTLEVKNVPRTRLSEAEISRVWVIVREFLRKHPSVTNRTLRAISGISYDQAIQFFNRMVDQGKLIREGKSSGVKYTLPHKL
jgi:predicted HTH transcriptional regulator